MISRDLPCSPILRAMLAVCGGDDFTIGVLWDYASLPQPSRSPSEHARFVEALRSLTTWCADCFEIAPACFEIAPACSEGSARSRRRLGPLTTAPRPARRYAHPFTHVLLMTAPLSSTAPSGAEHDNVEREYGARGWCAA